MRIKLSDHFSYKNLLRFVFPTILMMIFTSIYGVVDGLFISNFVGKTAFAAVNFIMPFLMILGAVGFMIGTGGTAIVSKTLGEGENEKANCYFSFLVYVTAVLGVVIAVLGELLIPYVTRWLGASEDMFDICVLYGRIIMTAVPFYMLQNLFQAFFTTAEKPKLGFAVTFVAGCTNMVLDALMVAVFKWGVAGAAIATALSQTVGAVIPLIYFAKKNSSLLRFTKCPFYGKVLLKTCTNGSSEFVSNISGSVVGMVFNSQLMRLAGENGVSAYGVMMYVCFIYVAIFIGYAIGTAPIIGFNYGAQNHKELKNIFKKSMILMAIFGVLMTLLAIVLAPWISRLFVGYDEELCEMTTKAFYLFSLSFVFTGFGIFGSSLFTALGNGAISAILSFLRTLVFQIGSVLILPIFFDIDGVWLSMLSAEILATILTVILCYTKRKKYHYA